MLFTKQLLYLLIFMHKRNVNEINYLAPSAYLSGVDINAWIVKYRFLCEKNNFLRIIIAEKNVLCHCHSMKV